MPAMPWWMTTGIGANGMSTSSMPPMTANSPPQNGRDRRQARNPGLAAGAAVAPAGSYGSEGAYGSEDSAGSGCGSEALMFTGLDVQLQPVQPERARVHRPRRLLQAVDPYGVRLLGEHPGRALLVHRVDGARVAA